MDRMNNVSASGGNGGAVQAGSRRQDVEDRIARAEQAKAGEQAWEQKSKSQSAGQAQQQDSRYKPKEYVESGSSILEQLRAQADSFKDAFDPKKKKNLYDATMDLMLIEQAEKIPALKAIQSRLLFKIRAVKASRAKASVIRSAVNKLKKVIGKAKGKVKSLQKEEQLEKKRKKAEEARRKAKAEALRRELEMRKKVRKAKERNDIEESKMGMGANYGGPLEAISPEIAAAAYGSTGTALPSVETGAAVDVAVADVGVAADAATGAVDVCI